MGLNFIEYDEWITKIRMVRNDLTPEKLKKEIDKLSHGGFEDHEYWVSFCYERAVRGEPMLWEN